MKYTVLVPFEVEANTPDQARLKVYLVVSQEADPDGLTSGVSYHGDLVSVTEGWTRQPYTRVT